MFASRDAYIRENGIPVTVYIIPATAYNDYDELDIDTALSSATSYQTHMLAVGESGETLSKKPSGWSDNEDMTQAEFPNDITIPQNTGHNADVVEDSGGVRYRVSASDPLARGRFRRNIVHLQVLRGKYQA